MEFVGKKNVIIPFKYVNISNVNHTVDSFILNSKDLRAGGCLRETVCVIYDFIGDMFFCWNHYRYGFLKSVESAKELSHKYISEIKIRILEKESPSNILNVKI